MTSNFFNFFIAKGLQIEKQRGKTQCIRYTRGKRTINHIKQEQPTIGPTNEAVSELRSFLGNIGEKSDLCHWIYLIEGI